MTPGSLKRHPVGRRARQYSAPRADGKLPGRVLLAYASRFGHALIDRELYVPQSWTGDRSGAGRGIPEERSS